MTLPFKRWFDCFSIDLSRRFSGAGLLSWLAASALLSCGGGTDGPGRSQPPAAAPEFASVQLDLEQRFQTLEGFGAAVGWYGEWLSEHPNASEVYQLLFGEIGLEVLRLRNTYGREEGIQSSADIVAGARAVLGHEPRVLLTSWSPPAELKDNGSTRCDATCASWAPETCLPICSPGQEATPGVCGKCTLAKDEQGQFRYADFAQYWVESLDAYAELNVHPTYVSLQNEPNFLPEYWEGCLFEPTEQAGLPSYAKALQAVHERLSQREVVPQLWGPETIGVHRGQVHEYMSQLDATLLSGVAHHMYEGEAWRSPDGYSSELRSITANYPDLPSYQTEFSSTYTASESGAFYTAWLIHTTLVEGSASGYVFWELIWEGDKGLVSMEHPNGENWQTERGYTVRDTSVAFRHFATFTDPGDVRVHLASDSLGIKSSAFLSADEQRLTVVLINASEKAREVRLNLDPFPTNNVTGYLTVADQHWQMQPNFDVSAKLNLAPQALLTLVAQR